MDSFCKLSAPFARTGLTGLALGAILGGPGLRASGFGEGMLMVTPHRVVLEDPVLHPGGERKGPDLRGRSAEILLINGGRKPATYRISFKNMDMDLDGHVYERPAKPGEVTAESLVRFSPHQVVLKPGASQVVRIQVRKPQGLPPGEYRSHLSFRALPITAPAPPKPVDKPNEDQPGAPSSGLKATVEDPEEETGQALTVDIKVVYGLSVPIIIRHGAAQVQTRLSDLHLVPATQAGNPPQLRMRINREGNRSVLGDLVVTWRPRHGLASQVGEHPGVSVYPSLPYRNVTMTLDGLQAKGIGAGSLKVEYLDPESRRVKAEAVLDFPEPVPPGPPPK